MSSVRWRPLRRSRGQKQEAGAQEAEKKASRTSAGALEELRQQAVQAGVECEAILGRGKPTATILETITVKKIDLTIMRYQRPACLERIVFDSTTEAVLRKAPCPVLTVGPHADNSEKALQSVGPVVFATDFHFTTIMPSALPPASRS